MDIIVVMGTKPINIGSKLASSVPEILFILLFVSRYIFISSRNFISSISSLANDFIVFIPDKLSSKSEVILLVNKWDAVEDKDDKTIYKFTEELRQKFAFMPYADIMFVSALTGQRLVKLYDEIDKVRQNQTLRVPTGVLNEILTEATAMHEPPQDKGKRLRLFYVTQVGVEPPTFVIFVNDRELFHFSYQRYIENRFREAFGFAGTPVHFIIRERKDKDA